MKNTYCLTLGGVNITVERKPIKNMYLRMHPDGQAFITAPKRMPDAVIERFASERLPWLLKKQQAATLQPDICYETGDTLPIWGNPCRLTVIPDGKRAHVDLLEDELRLSMPSDSTAEARKRAIDNALRKTLSTAIEAQAAACEQVVGKRASTWKIRDMKTRWGTCNTKSGAITINLQLVRRAPLYLTYVMLHELTHLWEPSHNARFYALMDRFCPDWKRIRKSLKQGG